MLDTDLDELDLGSRRKPVQWVSTAPPLLQREKRNPSKMNNAQRRARNRGANSPPSMTDQGGTVERIGASTNGENREINQRLEPRAPRKDGSCQNGRATHICPESEEGNVEYKLRLKEPTPHRFQQLVTQMKYRLSEGNGECYYYVGVEDDGYLRGLHRADLECSLATLGAMAREVYAAAVLLEEIPGAKGGTCALLRVHRICVDEASYMDLRIAVAGSVDSGKSTLVAVLSHGRDGRPLLDDGRGAARMSVLRHKHEIVSGRTSSIAQLITGYDAEGCVLNYAGVAPPTPAEIATLARKILHFIDLGGHEKYLKTALYGLTCMLPDHMLLCVCPVAGVGRVTREHLAAALALEVPLAIVLTKMDIVPRAVVDATLADIRELLAAASAGTAVREAAGPPLPRAVFAAPFISSEAEAAEVAAARHVGDSNDGGPSRVINIPVFGVSSVTGAGLSLLHAFLAGLTPLPHDSGGAGECRLGGPSGLSPAASSIARTSSSSSSCSSTGVDNEEDVSSCDGADGVLLAASPPTGSCYVQEQRDAHDSLPLHFQVDHMFEVRGVGSVVSGTVVAGVVSVGQRLLLGPSPAGGFNAVTVSGIQRAQLPVKRVKTGQHATLAIQPDPEPETPESDTISSSGGFTAGPHVSQILAPSTIGNPNQSSAGYSGNGSSAPPSGEGEEGMSEHSQAGDSLGGISRAEQLGAGSKPSPLAQEGYRIPRRTPQSTSGFGAREGAAFGQDAVWAFPSHSSPPLFVHASPSSRKGAVLLDTAVQPRTAWEFEAVLVLLSGHWPARGLLSRRYPPRDPSAGSPPETQLYGCLGTSPRGSRGNPRRQGTMYSPIIHCGSVRQAAHVIHMEEVPADVACMGRVGGCSLASALAAGAALLEGGSCSAASGSPGLEQRLANATGCTSRVRFRFAQRPEWLRPGARLIVRDPEDGGAAGAGIVEEVLWDALPQ